MLANISTNNATGYCIASKTFPVGFSYSAFATDAAPFEFENLQIGDAQASANGDVATWGKATLLKLTINLIADTQDDRNFSTILQQNMIRKGRVPANDIITMTIILPNGRYFTLAEGVITEGSPLLSATSEGRAVTKQYKFSFANFDQYFGIGI